MTAFILGLERIVARIQKQRMKNMESWCKSNWTLPMKKVENSMANSSDMEIQINASIESWITRTSYRNIICWQRQLTVMYTSSNVYSKTITLQTVSMVECVLVVIELQGQVRIDTYFDFDKIWTINGLERHKLHERQLATTRNQSVVILPYFDCWQITVVVFWPEDRVRHRQ